MFYMSALRISHQYSADLKPQVPVWTVTNAAFLNIGLSNYWYTNLGITFLRGIVHMCIPLIFVYGFLE